MDERWRSLSEAECYERCYGWQWSDDAVRVLPSEGLVIDLRHERSEAGERLRKLLELRIDEREPDAA